jgi:thiamine-monophosphate kinase
MAALVRLDEQAFIDLIARLSTRSPKRAVLGIGDDAAVVSCPARQQTLITTDLLTDGVHFRVDRTPGDLLGRKALSVNLSDVAAMGGAPHSCVISVGLPRRLPARYAADLARGLTAQARRFGVMILGGDTCAARSLFVSVALLGGIEPGRAVRRAGARVGDGLFVTGRLGASAAGLALLNRGARCRGSGRLTGVRMAPSLRKHAARCVRSHLNPEPRVLGGRALGLTGLATAMIDLSDGLAQDLPRLCQAGGTGALLQEAAIPVAPSARALQGRRASLRTAMIGGEDYELLFAARMAHAPLIARLARRLRLPMAHIGEVRPRGDGIRVLTIDGCYRPLPRGGFEHFRRRRPRH